MWFHIIKKENGNGEQTKYTYDKQKRITKVESSAQTRSYKYDQGGLLNKGKLTSLDHGGGVRQEFNYNYDGDQKNVKTIILCSIVTKINLFVYFVTIDFAT